MLVAGCDGNGVGCIGDDSGYALGTGGWVGVADLVVGAITPAVGCTESIECAGVGFTGSDGGGGEEVVDRNGVSRWGVGVVAEYAQSSVAIGVAGIVVGSPATCCVIGKDGAAVDVSCGDGDSSGDVADGNWDRGIEIVIAELAFGAASPTTDGLVGQDGTGVGVAGCDGDGGGDVFYIDWGRRGSNTVVAELAKVVVTPALYAATGIDKTAVSIAQSDY